MFGIQMGPSLVAEGVVVLAIVLYVLYVLYRLDVFKKE